MTLEVKKTNKGQNGELRKEVEKMIQGIYATGEKITYSDWLDEWLLFRQTRVRESTYIRYRNAINNHIRPYLGKYPIHKIDTLSIETYVQELLRSGRLNHSGGLSSKSVADILTIVKETFRYAQSCGVESACRFEYVCVRREMREMRVFSRGEERELVAFLMADTDFYKLGVFLSLYTGIRIGELCALQWRDISLSDRTLRVSRTMQRLQKTEPGENRKTHIVITEPKSGKSKRLIPLPGFVVETVSVFADRPDAYVLTGSGTKYVEPRTMQNRFKMYLSQSGIADANFHTLRHTFATRCVELGFDMKSLSEILGHSSVKITLDKYVHASLEQKRINMEKLQASYESGDDR